MQSNLLKPKTIQVEQLSAHRAKVVLEPFERGYGHTLGNALAACLVVFDAGLMHLLRSRLPVCLHEYSSIDGVHEDVVNILVESERRGVQAA
jgi:DNA-directed RNA polymerase subunit alpha